VTVAFGLVSAVMVIAGAALLARIVDRIFLGGAGPGDTGALLGLLMTVYLARGALEWGRSVAAHRAASTVKRTLRERAVRAALIAAARGQGAATGDLAVTVASGIDALDAYFARYLPQLILGALIPLAALGWILAVDPLTAVIVVVTVPLIPIFMSLIGAYADRATRARWSTIRALGDGLVEILRGLLPLEVYGAVGSRIDRIRRLSEAYRRQTLATLRIAFLSAFVLELVATISTAVIAVAIGLRVVRGDLAFEPAFAILILAPEIYAPLRRVGAEFHAAMDGVEAAKTIFAVIDEEDDATGGSGSVAVPRPAPGAPLVRFEAVAYRHAAAADGPAALDAVELELSVGEHIAVIGPSGAGKTTLLRLMLGFGRPAAGRLTFAGVPVADADVVDWRSRVGWVRQDPFLIAGTVLDNVLLGAPAADREAAAHALELVGAADLVPRLDERILELGTGLSHGERRMVTFARALARDPELLLLDEPAAGLDTDTQLRIAASFERLAKGRTVVTVAHQPVLIGLADRVVVLERGRVADVTERRRV
jgi:thiol reductant ABC exporter CydD subunit